MQQDRKSLLWGKGSPLDPVKGLHGINSDIMLLGQQTHVDWWRQTIGMRASCFFFPPVAEGGPFEQDSASSLYKGNDLSG